jgi:2-methylcitrate dehydratase PrpD
MVLGPSALHSGWVGPSGVIATPMAGLGFQGSHKVLEGRFGLVSTHLGAGNFDEATFTAGSGTDRHRARMGKLHDDKLHDDRKVSQP